MAEQNNSSAASSQNVSVDASQGASTVHETVDSSVDPTAPESVLDAEAVLEDAAEVLSDDENSADQDADANAEVAEWKDKYLRLHAEWDTYRRRVKEQQEQQKVMAAEKVVTSLLPLLDDLERSINYAQDNGEQGLLDGIRAVYAKFISTLESDGVSVIDPQGKPFDSLEAQAVGTVEDASQPDETVHDVYQKGFKLGEKVLRPAMVTVTSGGPKRASE